MIGGARSFEEVAEAIESLCPTIPGFTRPMVPFMDPRYGRIVFDHIRTTGARRVLDIGTAHGASAAYMAAALDPGHPESKVVTVDAFPHTAPTPQETFEAAGVVERVEIVKSQHSGYSWWLKEQVEARLDEDGNVEPLFDFCYLDGAKDWNMDGVSVILIERLLKPGGWLLLDDLGWSYESTGYEPVPERFSYAERSQPHLRAVFDLIVRAHPSFTKLRVQDGWWGWAKKAPGEPREYELETTRGLVERALGRLRSRVRR